MSLYIHKSHNVTVLLFHLVFPAKYRRAVFDAAVDQTLRDVCLGIEARYQLKFLEIGADRDHVHVLVQSVPTYGVTKLVTTIKSLTAREIFRRCPQVKKRNYSPPHRNVFLVLNQELTPISSRCRVESNG